MHRLTRGKSCPRCGSRDLQLQDTLSSRVSVIVCLTCDHEFEVGGHREKPRGSHRDGAVNRREIDWPGPSFDSRGPEGKRKNNDR